MIVQLIILIVATYLPIVTINVWRAYNISS